MIEFKRITLDMKTAYEELTDPMRERGCEYSFANLYLWGRQQICFMEGGAVLFSQFDRKTVYPYPVTRGDVKPLLDDIIRDASRRGIPCRLTGLSQGDCQQLEELYPGRFRIHTDRSGFDYIYDIQDLAGLAGRKYQKKRNHVNSFTKQFPDWTVLPIDRCDPEQVEGLVSRWYEDRLAEDPDQDFRLEQAALKKALRDRKELGMEGMVLIAGGEYVAMTLASRLSEDTFDVHFEKALSRDNGAYAVINREFARYLMEAYPEVRWLNREDDLGIEGLRQAKLSYLPARMVEKHWTCLLEDCYEY